MNNVLDSSLSRRKALVGASALAAAGAIVGAGANPGSLVGESASAVSPPGTYGQEMGLAVPAYDIMWEKNPDERKRRLELMKGTGVKYIRTDLWLESLTWDNGNFVDYASIDGVVNDLRAYGFTVVFVVHTLPNFAGVTVNRTGPNNQRQRDIYTDFITKMVRRYKGKVKYWEIWNEENLADFWGVPNWKNYALLLKQVYPAIKKIDPTAVVISGGTGGKTKPIDIDPIQFLTNLYKYGELKKYTDAVAIHAYANMDVLNIGEFYILDKYRKVMDDHGDKTKKMWITEGGAKVVEGSKTATKANQTGMMPQLATAWSKVHHRGPMMWFSLFDTEGYGLMEPDKEKRTKRPSYYTLQAITAHKA